jgi:hypothetical protein
MGSGKTHLRKKIEGEKKENDIIFNLDTDNAQFNLDAQTIKDHSGRLKNYISLEILRNLLKHIDSLNTTDKTLKEKLNNVFQAGVGLLSKIPEAVDLKVPYATIDLKKIFESDNGSLVQSAWQKIIDDLFNELSDQKIYILIDDAEDVFKNLEKSPDFIEALSRSIKDINNHGKEKIHALLFLKKGIWRIWYENPREYDKVKTVIEFIQWSKNDVLDILTKRIAEIHNIKFIPSDREKIWSKEFDFKKQSFKEISDFMYSLIINGPRDIIEIANEAKFNSEKTKISLEEIKKIESQYSQDKLYGLNADFGDIYPSIHNFIEIVFNGEQYEMSGKEFQDAIELKGLADKKVQRQFKDIAWFEELGKKQVAVMLYKIGFIRVKVKGQYYHSIEKADLKPSDISGNTIQIHPAFRSHLGMA